MSAPKKSRKIAVMGFRGVGKSSITIQFVESHFVDTYNPTIENTFEKPLKLSGDDYDCQIVDTAGQDEYSLFQPRHFVGVNGYILVYSVNNRNSLEMLKAINEKILNAHGSSSVPRCLVGNKCDLDNERQISTEEGRALAKEWGCLFFETSAKHNENIGQAFTGLLMEIEKGLTPQPQPEDKSCIIL